MNAPRPLTFFGGKGGVGKTTCAAARALQYAQQGARVLLVSTDPAHSLGDLLERRLSAKPKKITARLAALEMDPEGALKRYLDEIKSNLRELASPELRDAAERQAELAGLAPGASDAALFDEMVRLILDSGERYDQLIFDTAPTGHTLHLLALPEIMGAWTQGLLARRAQAREQWLQRMPLEAAPEDRAAHILEQRRERFAAARERLLDAGRTRFVPVLNPDALSREETRRMVDALGRQGITLDTLIINRVLPLTIDGGEFLQRRRQTQTPHLQAIEREFRHLRQVQIPLSADEIQGLEALEQFAALLPALGPDAASSGSARH